MEKCRVLFENRQKDIKIPSGLKLLVRKSCHAVLKLEDFEGCAEISVSFVTEQEIKALNHTYRDKDMITDVLSFPLAEGGELEINHDTGDYLLGDVVLCMQRAKEQADEFGHSFQREIVYLTVHSVLHLLGYDHEEDREKRIQMREKEEYVMKMLGLSRAECFV